MKYKVGDRIRVLSGDSPAIKDYQIHPSWWGREGVVMEPLSDRPDIVSFVLDGRKILAMHSDCVQPLNGLDVMLELV